jgi:hypothetical protein
VRLGDVATALAAEAELPDELRAAFGFEAVPMARALTFLQAGRTADARAVVGGPGVPLPRIPIGLQAVRALVLAVEGAVADAETEAVEVLRGHALYFERVLAHLASAAAAVRLGDVGRARRSVDEAEREVAGTEDVVTAALVSRARAIVLAAVGHGGAAEAAALADRQAAAIGCPLAGWVDVLRAAVGATTQAVA